MSYGETVIVEGVVTGAYGADTDYLYVPSCRIIQHVHAPPKPGDLVKFGDKIMRVDKFSGKPDTLVCDGQRVDYPLSTMKWPTEEEVKAHKLKALADVDEDDLFAEILRRKDAKARAAAAPAIVTSDPSVAIGNNCLPHIVTGNQNATIGFFAPSDLYPTRIPQPR